MSEGRDFADEASAAVKPCDGTIAVGKGITISRGPILLKVDYAWICEQMLLRSKYPDMQEAIRILKELDKEQG